MNFDYETHWVVDIQNLVLAKIICLDQRLTLLKEKLKYNMLVR